MFFFFSSTVPPRTDLTSTPTPSPVFVLPSRLNPNQEKKRGTTHKSLQPIPMLLTLDPSRAHDRRLLLVPDTETTLTVGGAALVDRSEHL